MADADFSYVTDLSAGSGARSRPRSRIDTDAPSLDLTGMWRFRLHSGVAAATRADDLAPFWESGFDDSGSDWHDLPVPSHWVLEGASSRGDGSFGLPAYTNVQLPFPIDPPAVPDENRTGDHWRTFELGPEWSTVAGAGEGAGAGGACERLLLRFDGVESVAKVWVNGLAVGVVKGSRLTQELDVTEAVRPGTNTLAVRVHQWSSQSYVEDQDMWWLPGIFRDVTLLARPVGGFDDVWLRCGWQDGVGTIDPEIVAGVQAWPVTLTVPELGINLTWAGPEEVAAIEVPEAQPWSPDSPTLYAATVRSMGETVSLRVGFRSVRIDGDRLLVNGRPLRLAGVNRHDTNPDLGRVFDEQVVLADLLLMKRSNINAIRTSHYPPHPRLLQLCDELGFWVMDECDLETHAFEKLDWQGNPSDDPDWRDALLDRMERTVERDKNHPCIVIWSLGNEAGTGRNLAAMAAWTRRRDSTRPVQYEGDHRVDYADLYSRMYPSLEEVDAICGDSGAISGAAPGVAARIRRLPFLMIEYVHAMGNGPGGLRGYEDQMDRYERHHGGFVWEWRDHGIRVRRPAGTVDEQDASPEFFAYGGDFGEEIHDGNFVMDGLVRSDGTPSPGLTEVAAVFTPLPVSIAASSVRSSGEGSGLMVTLANRHHSSGTHDFRWRWQVTSGPDELGAGEATMPQLPAGETGRWPLGRLLPEAEAAYLAACEVSDGEVALTVTTRTGGDLAWAPAGHVVSRAQWVRAAFSPAPAGATGSLSGRGSGDGFVLQNPLEHNAVRRQGAPFGERAVGPAVVELATGKIIRLGDLAVDGPDLSLWRAPTDNDSIAGWGSYEVGDPVATHGKGTPAPASADRWRQAGLHRVHRRLLDLEVDDGSGAVTVWTRHSAADRSQQVDVRWRIAPVQARNGGEAAVDLDVDITPGPGWTTTWPRVGVRLGLPSELGQARWLGMGPGEAYVDSCEAAWLGLHEASLDDDGPAGLFFRYAVPQESGHRPGLRWLELSGATADAGDRAEAGGGIRLEARRVEPELPGFAVTPWSAEELSVARHWHELPSRTATWLYVDAGHHGLGTRSCGPDARPEAQLWPRAASLSLRLSPLRAEVPAH